MNGLVLLQLIGNYSFPSSSILQYNLLISNLFFCLFSLLSQNFLLFDVLQATRFGVHRHTHIHTHTHTQTHTHSNSHVHTHTNTYTLIHTHTLTQTHTHTNTHRVMSKTVIRLLSLRDIKKENCVSTFWLTSWCNQPYSLVQLGCYDFLSHVSLSFKLFLLTSLRFLTPKIFITPSCSMFNQSLIVIIF